MASGWRLSAATGLHKGDRDYQQDQLVLLQHPRAAGCLLAVVADGMGGRSGGRKASDQVVLTATQLFERYTPSHDDPVGFLRDLVHDAHTAIRLTAMASEQEPHSTLAAFLVDPEGDCHWVHAGDSRIYQFHGEKLLRRTLDHSYVQLLVSRGEIDERQARDHPQSNILMGCLGADEPPPAEVHSAGRLRVGDTLLACSDGLWHYFEDDELASILAAMSPREASRCLVDQARLRARGGGDNLSLVILRVEPPLG